MRDPKTIEETVAKALESQNVELVDLVIQNQGKKQRLASTFYGVLHFHIRKTNI